MAKEEKKSETRLDVTEIEVTRRRLVRSLHSLLHIARRRHTSPALYVRNETTSAGDARRKAFWDGVQEMAEK